jgi:hypothetical protein
MLSEGQGYGIYVPGGTFTPPLTEDMVDSLPADYAKTVVYPWNRKLLNAACKGQKWTWCEVCPDAIVSFHLLCAMPFADVRQGWLHSQWIPI